MTATNFIPKPPLNIHANAKGYRADLDIEGELSELAHTEFERQTEISPGAAGSIFSTLSDMTEWLKVHANSSFENSLQLVSPTNLAQMHLPHTIIPGGGFNEALMGQTISTYGLGWFIEPYKGTTLIHHGGNLVGHSLIAGFIPEHKVGVVALTNIAFMPLRDVLLYESVDRVLNLPRQDWNNKFHEIYDPFIQGHEKQKQTSVEDRIEDAPATHSLKSYAGVYEADGYPDFEVKFEESGLQASTTGSLALGELRHYHYNTFEWHLVDFDDWIKVQFNINGEGEVESVSIPIEPAVENVVFERKNLELSDDVISSLTGKYNLPADGIGFDVSSNDGKVFVAMSGEAAEEIKAYELTDKKVCFKMKRNRLEFMRKEKQVSHLIFKSPYTTLNAMRESNNNSNTGHLSVSE